MSQQRNNENKWNDDQRLILNTLSGNMVASASAGSGKTTVMLERIIRLIKLKQPLRSMVILAYNISIATEIKDKLRNELINLLQEPDIDKVFIGEQIDSVEGCNICTIDSFCSGLIKEYFQLIKIDTNFIIMTDVQQKSEFRRLAKSIIQDEKDNNHAEIYSEITMFGSEEKLIQTLLDMNNYITVLPDRHEYLSHTATSMYKQEFNLTNVFSSFKALIDKRIKYARDILSDTLMFAGGLAEKKVGQLNDIDAMLLSINKANTYESLYNITQCFNFTKQKITAADSEEAFEHYSNAFYLCKDVIKFTKNQKTDFEWINPQNIALQQQECGRIIEHIVSMLDKLSQSFIEYKRERGLFDFSDLTYWAIKVLEHDSVSEELKQRYTSVCIDEFQDANYCQEYILSRIANDNLFVVGDTKQSIYGFRLAEPTILSDKFAASQLDSKSVAVRLNYNYRSDEYILEFVNKIFDLIMLDTLTGVNYRKNERLKAGMKYEHSSAVNNSFEIDFFVSEKLDDKVVYDFNSDIYDITSHDCGKNIPACVLKEAEHVSNKIKSLVGHEDIYDPKIKSDSNDGWRKVKYSDICIIARSRRTQLQQIISVISQNGIPIDSKSLEKTNQDYYVNTLNEMLKVVDNDKQDAQLAAALVSPWGRMSYDELIEIRANNPRAKFFHEACLEMIDKSPKIEAFYALLDRARVKLATSSLHELASWLVYDNYYYDAIGLEVDGDNRKHILKQYLDLIKSSNINLSEYVNGLEGELKFEFSQYPDNMARDMVSTATVHYSKGLEYPIVFLVDCDDPIHKRGDPNNVPIIFPRRIEGLAINCYDRKILSKSKSIFANIFKAIKRNEEELEAMRVFYVALTRARNKLYVSGNFEISKAAMEEERMPNCDSLLNVSSPADWILYVKDKDACISKNFKFIICNSTTIKEGKYSAGMSFPSPCKSRNAAFEEVLNYVYPHENVKGLGIKYSVTEINQIGIYEDAFESELTLPYENVDKALRGTNYHKVLEHIDYRATDAAAVQCELSRMVAEELISTEELELVNPNEIAKVLSSGIIQYAAKFKHLREKKFMLLAKASQLLQSEYGEEEILVQGAIDLVILGDKTYVVDFKKTRKSDEQIRQSYSKQLDIYALAVQEALGLAVDGKIIVEIGSGREILL